ncbi:MAG TPA: AAA family ATPase, partial [Solirubrobacterales bacterium]|nr:AAA family ATPase [Solirubrobacterales bacterium]
MEARTELLEREAELAAIEAALGRARGGDGAVLTIEGEAGAGKTSLLAAANELAAAAGMSVLRARGGEYERDFPYGVIRQLFEPPLAEPRRRADLLGGTAALAAPLFEPGAGIAESEPFNLQHGLYWLLVELAAAGPLALLVDDAQWADLASLGALVYAARRLEELPVALVLTVRTGVEGDQAGALRELRRQPDAVTIEPPPLSPAGVATLLSRRQGRAAGDAFASACREATAGNPLLLLELLRSLELDRLEPGDASVERLAELAAAGISGSILGRLEQLGPDAVAVARAVAILEPNAELRHVAAFAGRPQERATAACERLIAAQLLIDARPLGFVHPLVRAAVLGDVSATGLAAAHARAARLLHEDGAERDSVAAHLLLSEPAADAWVVAELRAAATDALRRGAPEAAVRYLRRALREPPARAERGETSRELGSALLIANDPEGLDVLRAVRAASGDAVERAGIAIELGNSLCLREGGEEGAVLLEESLAELGDRGSELSLHVRGFLLQQLIWGLERLPADAMPREGEPVSAGSRSGRLLLQSAALLTALGLGSMGEARALAERVAATPRELLWEDGVAGLPPQGLALALVMADRGDIASDLLELAIETARRRGSAGLPGGYGLRGFCRYLEGDLREAQADLEIVVPVLGAVGLVAPAVLYLSAIAATMLARGEAAAAAASLEAGSAGREPPSGTIGSVFLAGRADLHRAAGRFAEARRDYLAAADRLRWLPAGNGEVLSWRTGLACCEHALGNGEEARRLAAEATAIASEAGAARALGIALRTQALVGDGE